MYESFDFWMEWILEGALSFSSTLPPPIVAIFGGTNKEMTNTMTSHVHLYKELEKEQV